MGRIDEEMRLIYQRRIIEGGFDLSHAFSENLLGIKARDFSTFLDGLGSIEDWNLRSAALQSSLDALGTDWLRENYRGLDFPRIQSLAEQLQEVALPASLADYRSSLGLATAQIIGIERLGIGIAEALPIFGETSAFASLLRHSSGATEGVMATYSNLLQQRLPEFPSVGAFGEFLNIAGLSLGRWPQVRLLTPRERQQRLRLRVRRLAPAPHVKKAKNLVHQHELMLREIIDDVMAAEYGEEWPLHRLVVCGCKDLIGRWQRINQGNPLDYADYAHYIRIMTHDEHFSAVFSAGFDDDEELARLLKQAGDLRACSHHARDFALEDLRELRIVWNVLVKGLATLIPGIIVET